MQKIIWDKRYNIYNGIIDKQHQYLVKLINLIADETEYISTEAVKAIFADVGVTIIAVLNAFRALNVKNL